MAVVADGPGEEDVGQDGFILNLAPNPDGVVNPAGRLGLDNDVDEHVRHDCGTG